MTRIGLIGFGFIGEALCKEAREGRYPGLEMAFVWNRSPDKLAGLPRELLLTELADAPRRGADLVIETANPEISIAHGAAILASADYMPLSVTALADDALRDELTAMAAGAGHRLLLPQGALVG